eukprot:6470665-Amphidinium_carterae.1
MSFGTVGCVVVVVVDADGALSVVVVGGVGGGWLVSMRCRCKRVFHEFCDMMMYVIHCGRVARVGSGSACSAGTR